MNDQSPVQTPAQLVEDYIHLRDEKKRADELFAEHMKLHYGEPMREIEAKLLDILNQLGSDSIKSKAGTAYRKLSTSVTVADMREFRRHVIGEENWDLADWRANKTVVQDLVEAGEPLPPGINYTPFYSVGIRRS